MAFNVADFNSFIRGYMINAIKQKNPNLDISDNSAFDDLFVKPMTSLIAPIIDTVNSLEFRMDLGNAEFMEEADLDDIGSNNFLIERDRGDKAITTLTLSFLKVAATNLIIPAGATFETEAGLKFQTTQKYEFTPAQMLTKYNISKTTYDIDITVEAFDVGTSYNVSENQITKSVTNISPYLNSITNKLAVTSGVDKESNVDYAQRIREYYVSRHLGTKPGYRQFIFSNFSEVEDIYIVGFGDPEMTRDTEIVLIDSIPTEKHMGGKVDGYIKGCKYGVVTKTINLNSKTLKLVTPSYSDLIIESTLVENLTDPVKTPVFSVTEDTDGKAIVTLDNTDEVSFDPDIINSIRVTYETESGFSSETFNVGLTEFTLNAPFKSIMSIYETEDQTKVYTDPSYYQITRTRIDGTPITMSTDIFYGTTQEIAKMKLVNLDAVHNGISITINYTVNDTLKGIMDIFDIEENRIITTDLLFKEADPIFINVGMSVKLRAGQTLDDVKISAINNNIATFFDKLQLGSIVEESDLIGSLYKDTTITSFLEYVLLPLNSFYVPEDPAADIIIQRDGTYISVTNTQYPALNKISVSAIT